MFGVVGRGRYSQTALIYGVAEIPESRPTLAASSPPPTVTLIGMPGCGKSTVGRVLADRLGVPFTDPDRLIEAGEGKPLGEVLAGTDRDGFRAIEEQYNLAVPAAPAVVAPGGSVIYGEAAMRHLSALGPVVWLDVPLAVIESRLGCLRERAVVMAPGTTMADLEAERRPLLERWATLRVDCGGRGPEELAELISHVLTVNRRLLEA